MKIALASDHAGYELKEYLKRRLTARGYRVIDYGVEDPAPSDYPDTGRPAAQAVARRHCERGILVDGAGIAMSMVANRVAFVRAAVCTEPSAARMARAHNDANVLCLGGRMIGTQMADWIVDAFLETPFEGGRHQRRVDKIEG